MHPTQTLDARNDLATRLHHHLVNDMWSGQIGLDWEANLRGSKNFIRDAKRIGGAVFDGIGRALPAAEVFHVVPDMSTLVEHAAAGLDETDVFRRDLAPVPIGLARFDRGLTFTDVRGQTLRVNWVLWTGIDYTRTSASETGTMIYMWNDTDTDPDDITVRMFAEIAARSPAARKRAAAILQASGRWGFIGAQFIPDGALMGPVLLSPTEDRAQQIAAEGDTATLHTNMVRLLHAFWLLLGQTVARSAETTVDRHAVGRARAAGLPSRVTVVELRRSAQAASAGPAGVVEWSHRWFVRGFWRWNVCGPDHPLGQELEPGKWRARVWVAPFVKGPADKPLVQSEKVYQLKR